MSPFDFGSDISPEAVLLIEKFVALHMKIEALTKCIPDDHEDLAEEKRQWMNKWTLATEASKMHKWFTEQVCITLLAKINKHEQERLATATNEKGKEKEVAVADMPMEEVTSSDVEGTVVPSVYALFLASKAAPKGW
ncbi:hypothetical protein BDR07DRAFT_1489168 [Suillus spraguei]|nr:hypothetical protein BDR07DRAFT_1500359 [Suillus spraguei]KAG2358661.1 hypothetical protein BDR07DRAFT_1489168 [Suillus spraguei]